MVGGGGESLLSFAIALLYIELRSRLLIVLAKKIIGPANDNKQCAGLVRDFCGELQIKVHLAQLKVH